MNFSQSLAKYGADDRMWKLTASDGTIIGHFMYGNVINYLGAKVLSVARFIAAEKAITMEVVGNLYPLEELSNIPELQAEKNEHLKRERKADRKYAKKKGYKLESKIYFGKYKDKKTFKEVIDTDRSYWNWMFSENGLTRKPLLHPEIKDYLLTLI